MEFGIPVHQPFSAIDQAFVVQAHEGFGDGLGQTFVHREAFARPVRRGAETAHLARDGVAGVLLPLPDFFDEFFAAEIVARNALRVELALHDDLCRDAGVVGARLPQRIITFHAVIAGQRIHQGLVETMSHVQRAGDVGWRQQDTECFGFACI